MNKKFITTFPLAGFLLLFYFNPVFAREVGDLEKEIRFLQAEMYETTSARRKIKATESPAAITIITREEIENSWATSIPDLLRNVLGVDVTTIYAGTQMLSVRGSNPFSSLKVALLVDGQLLEPLIYGTNTWSQIPVSIQDIEKIEVVRSPGVLYGANAFYSLVNIITKLPTEKPKTSISMTGGEFETLIGTITTSGKVDRFGYRLNFEGVNIGKEYPKTADTDDFDRTSDSHETVNALFNYTSEDETSHWTGTFANNFYEHWNRIQDRLCESLTKGDHRYAKLKYKKDLDDGADFEISLNHDFSSFEIPNNRVVIADPFIPDIHKSQSSLNLQHSRPIGERNFLVLGFEAKHERTDDEGNNSFMKKDVREEVYSAFIQDQFTLYDNVKLFAGGRLSHHYITDTRFSPSGSLVYTPAEGHTIRMSVSRVYRDPNVYETFMNYAQPSGHPGKIGWYKGNENLDPEVNNAYELSYQFRSSRFKFETTGFFYDTEDLIEHRQIGNATVDGVYLPVFQFFNQTDGRAFGIEVGGEFQAMKNLSLFANTTYQKIENNGKAALHPDGRMGEEYSPEWKVNAGIDYKPFDFLRANLTMNYVDSVVWERPAWSSATGTESIVFHNWDPSVILNLNLAWRPVDFLKVALKVYNLLDKEHMEWPVAGSSFNPRRLLVNVTYDF